MDIQPVFNHCKAVTYMCEYLSKTENECSQAMSEAVKESLEANFSNYEQMRSIAQAYSSKRELVYKRQFICTEESITFYPFILLNIRVSKKM